MRFRFTVACLMLLLQASVALAQFKTEENGKGAKLGEVTQKKYRVGVVVTAKGAACKGILATVPVPIEWPEQQVRIGEEVLTPQVKNVGYRTIGGTVKQMTIDIPYIEAGQEAQAMVTFEITKHKLLPPENTAEFSIPKKLPRNLLIYTGPSPFIESRHPKIVSLASEIVADKSSAWEQVEAIYDWVRENVKYENGELKGALKALNDKTGDCEELSSLFIALCRAKKIPARTVWVPDHCYPEFYLTDADGNGHWFPCQAAGARAFGGIPEERPILQKGDNFKDPDRPKEKLRYVSENLIGNGGRPRVKFVREPVE